MCPCIREQLGLTAQQLMVILRPKRPAAEGAEGQPFGGLENEQLKMFLGGGAGKKRRLPTAVIRKAKKILQEAASRPKATGAGAGAGGNGGAAGGVGTKKQGERVVAAAAAGGACQGKTGVDSAGMACSEGVGFSSSTGEGERGEL